MSDEAILNAAATVFAGLCASGKVSGGNDKGAMQYSLSVALQLANASNKQSFNRPELEGGEVPFPLV